MKKIILILIIFLTFLIVLDRNTLKGEKITSALYKYNLSTDEILINNNNIYALTKNTLEIQNLYNQKETKKINNTCFFVDLNIICKNADNYQIYDLNYNFKTTLNSNTYFIPYQNDYLKLTSDTLSFKNKNITLDEKLMFSTYVDYFKTNNNIYLLYSDYNLNKSYLFNFNTKEIITIDYLSYHKYNSGFYFYDDYDFLIYDLNNKSTKEFTNFELNSDVSTYQDNNLYLYNASTLTIINLKNQTYQKIPFKIPQVKELRIENNYLYFIADSVYLLDLTKIEENPLSIKNYYQEEQNYITSTLNDLQQNYHLNIFLKNDMVLDFPDFTAQPLTQNYVIAKSLNKITSILTKFDLEFYNSFYDQNYLGLNIYLTGKLTPKDLTKQIANPSAYSLIDQNKYMIVIDITENNLEKIMCHELFHNIEFNLSKNHDVFTKWDSYNPKDFSYNNSYTKDYFYNYTLEEKNKNNIYFIDKYSHTYPEEDRARIFENICAFNTSPLINFPNLTKKAQYLKEEVLLYYPTLANLFISIP